jgi:tetratricopeptide (TPR) repeat protein
MSVTALLTACGTTGVAPAPDAVAAAQSDVSTGSPADVRPIREPLPELPVPDVTSGNFAAFEQAITAIREGRLQAAEILLLEITVDQPELAGPWINLGQVYIALEQPEEARIAFRHAILANPRSCPAYNELGVLSRRYGDFAGAEEHYRTCIDLVPGFKDAYLNLGILYELYLGRLPEALEYYRAYQSLLSEPDRRVMGWVMDLERRLGV